MNHNREHMDSDAVLRRIRERFGTGPISISTGEAGGLRVSITDPDGVTHSGVGNDWKSAIRALLALEVP